MELRALLSWKTARFVAATVVLGAIGSGTWEWLLKPFLMGASELGLNIATLGVQSFKDSLYKDVAQGFHEGPSLRLYVAVFSGVPAFILGVVSGIYSAIRFRSRAKRGDVQTSFDRETSFDRVMGWLLRPTLVLFLFLLVFSIIQANQLAYVNRAILHFQQMLTIAEPYLTEEARLQIRSEFAQISSREDYSKIIVKLNDICQQKKLRAPEFAIW